MPGSVVRRLGRVLATALLAAPLVVLTGLPAVAAAATEPVEPAPLPVEPPATAHVLGAPVVVAGIGGLGWDDVSPERTPELWALLEDGASAAAVTVHTTGQPACPEGGWLSLSAGRAVPGQRFAGSCLGLSPVEPFGDGGGHVAEWSRLRYAHADSTYQAEIGTLGPTLEPAGCVTAVGPGAALALAGQYGTLDRYRATLTADALDCPVTVVDLGTTSRLDDLRDGALVVDQALADLVDRLAPGTSLLVTSVSAPLLERLQMGVMVVAAPDQDSSLLASASTRRPGVVRLLDVPTTLVALLGLPEPDELQGSPITSAGDRGEPASVVESLADITVADRGLRAATNPLLNSAGAATLLLVGLALLWPAVRRAHDDPGPAVRGELELALLWLAALPIAAYLVTLLRWWDFARPTLALWLGLAAIAAGLAVATRVVAGPLHQPVWRPALALAAVSTGVLVLDAITGARLHWGSPLGTSPVLGNRYYGFGNTTYAVFAVHTVLLAGVLASRLVVAGRRVAAAVTVLAIGMGAVAVDTWPTWGADVGGGLALVPAFGLLALAVSGARVTAGRTLAALLAGLVVVGGIAVLDWFRAPAQRSHAGRFVQQVVDGDAWDVVARKIDYAVASLGRGLTAWLTLAALVWAVLAVSRPRQFAPPSLRAAMDAWPGLRSTLAAILVTAVVGSLVNDWGIRIATVVLTAAVPVVATTCLRAAAQRRSSDLAVSRSAIATATASPATATVAAASPPPNAATNEASANRSPTW